MSTEFLSFFELKEVGDDGTFVGIASVYGVEDLGGDIIDKGAFKKTIAENPRIPILHQHKQDTVIGEGSVKEWQGKVLLEAKLDLDDPAVVILYGKMKRKLIKGLSIGFTTIKSLWEEVDGKMIRHITELKLWEVSVVTFPMLLAAQVTRVKSMEDDFCVALKESQAKDAQIAELAAQVQALQAAKATPQEPVQAEEPPSQQSNEPAVDHSALSSKLNELREALWN